MIRFISSVCNPSTEVFMTHFVPHAGIAVFLLFVTTLVAQDTPKIQPTLWAAKPDAAGFEKIENGKLAAAQSAIDAIVVVKGKRTVENTLVPFDEATRQLNSAAYFAGLMENLHPDADFRNHATEMVRKVSAAITAVSLNHDVYQALASLEVSKEDAATRYYVQR